MSGFEHLKHFIASEMRMSQIYQPLMLIELLKNNASASVNRIDQAFLNTDHRTSTTLLS